jgi:hypothetical protein
MSFRARMRRGSAGRDSKRLYRTEEARYTVLTSVRAERLVRPVVLLPNSACPPGRTCSR